MFCTRTECFYIIFLQMEVHNLILAQLLEFNDQNKEKAPQPQTPVCFFKCFICPNINASMYIMNRWMNKLRKHTVCSSLAHIYCNDLSDLHKVLFTVAENMNSSQNETFSCYHSSRQFFHIWMLGRCTWFILCMETHTGVQFRECFLHPLIFAHIICIICTLCIEIFASAPKHYFCYLLLI